jgi:hypothetical protein
MMEEEGYGQSPLRKTPREIVLALCVLGATTAYLLARSTRQKDVCAALSRFEQKYSMKFPTVDFVDDFQKLRQGCG